jgi:cytochrome P450
VNPASTATEATPDLDISARTFWAKPFEEREKTFRWLRENEPVKYFRPYESTLQPPDEDTPGFWSVTKYEDCRYVSRTPELFCSGQGIVMESFPEVVQVASTSFLAMDGEDHLRLRNIVAQAFTPRRAKQMEDWIRSVVREIVDEIVDKGEGDFCQLFAAPVPGRIFAHFFGVDPRSDEAHTLMDAAEKMLAWDDPRAAAGRDALTTFAEECERIQDVALAVAELRREEPADDLVSWVLAAEWEGEKMDDWEIAAFFSLLGSAANDTTRHSLAHAVRLLDENPDQKALLLSDLDTYLPNAIEEVLRHSTPVMHFRRTAMQDTEIRGVPIKEGDKVVMWYCSGDRDEEQFPDAARFDITRPNAKTHLAFGAGGPHFCIGAGIGRAMINAGLREIYTRMPDIHLTEPQQIQVNNFMHGVHAQPVAWTPTK